MIDPVTIAAIAVGLAIFYWIFLWESRTVKMMMAQFPGPKPLPFVGNALSIQGAPENVMPTFIKWHQQYGNRFRMFLGPNAYNFVSTNPADLEKLLTSSDILEKAQGYNVLKPWLGEGLLISKGKRWHTRRKQLTSAFHFKILDNFLHVFNDQSQVLVDIVRDKFVGSGSEKSVPAEVHELITRFTLDVICETAMGTKLNCQKDLTNEFADATLKESAYAWRRFASPIFRRDWAWALTREGREEKANRKILHDFTKKVIQDRKKLFEKESKEAGKNGKDIDDSENVYFSSKKKFAFLDQLLKIQADDPSMLTDEDIRAETDTFMFAGHDTTAASIVWTIFLLGLYPEHQAAVHAELDSIFGQDKTRPITPDDISQMKFLECCIKESLRVYPSVPFLSRKITQDFQLDENTILPKGAQVSFLTFLIHRNPEIFPQPEEFRPSRFFAENCSRRHPYAYIPFSAGPRNCIGQRFAQMEEKTVLAHLFRNFHIRSLENRESVKPLPEMIMRPQNGIHVIFTPR